MTIEFKIKEFPPGTIFMLRELSPKDMSATREHLQKGSMGILHHQDNGLFEWFVISSGKNLYEVTRLGYFARCTCRAFEFGYGGCKHIALTLPLVCVHCLEKPVRKAGDKCMECYHLTEGFVMRASVPRETVSTGSL